MSEKVFKYLNRSNHVQYNTVQQAQRATNTTQHGMLHPTIMYKNLFNLYSVKMSFVLFGTVSHTVQSVQCCDATFILDDIINMILLRWFSII